MEKLPVRKIPGIGEVTAEKLAKLGVQTCGELQAFGQKELQERFGKFGVDLYERCWGTDERPVQPDRVRKSLSNENTFPSNLTSLEECQERLGELHADLLRDLEKKAQGRAVAKLFVKVRFADFIRTTAECMGDEPALEVYRELLTEGWQRRPHARRAVRLLSVGFQVATESIQKEPNGYNAQMVLAL